MSENYGLTTDQWIIYKYLLDTGFSNVRKLSIRTGVNRTLTYRILEQLIKLNLVEKIEKKGSVTFFYPKNPSNIITVLERKEEELNQLKNEFHQTLPKLISSFNLLEGKPSVHFFEGIEGLQKLYEEILLESEPIKLLRSSKDISDEDIKKVVLEQIKRQTKKGIAVELLGPYNPTATKEFDNENNITRRFLAPEDLTVPAQIIIFGTKVGITSFGDNMITTIIDSKPIYQTFTQIFSLLWKNAYKPEWVK